MSKSRGAFIVLEGIDRCGKTTQNQMLVEALRRLQVPAEARRFPNRETATGRVINSYLQNSTELSDQVIHLLYSANRWEAADELQALLESGTSVVCDRYAYSGVAFSAAKGLDLQWCKEPDAGLVAPDLVIYLQLSVEESKQRGEFGEERYEKEAFQRQVQQVFQQLREEDGSWSVVDASRSVQEVHDEMMGLVRSTLERLSKEAAPLRRLW